MYVLNNAVIALHVFLKPFVIAYQIVDLRHSE